MTAPTPQGQKAVREALVKLCAYACDDKAFHNGLWALYAALEIPGPIPTHEVVADALMAFVDEEVRAQTRAEVEGERTAWQEQLVAMDDDCQRYAALNRAYLARAEAAESRLDAARREGAREALTKCAAWMVKPLEGGLATADNRTHANLILSWRDDRYPRPAHEEKRSRVVTDSDGWQFQFRGEGLWVASPLADELSPSISSLHEWIADRAKAKRYADASALAALAQEHFGGDDGK